MEAAAYTTDEPNRILVEFTTREPIRPLPDGEIIYSVDIDIDQPWTIERDDRDFLAGVAVQSDGSREVKWDAAKPGVGGTQNQIGVLIDLRTISAPAASITFRSITRRQGSWGHGDTGNAVVVVFPEVTASAPIDLSRPNSRFSPTQREVFRYPGIRDREEGVADVSCRIIEVLGDGFDFMAFNSQSRFDVPGASCSASTTFAGRRQLFLPAR